MTRFDEKDRIKMAELYATGYSKAAIARRFGCSSQYVSDVLEGRMNERVESKKTGGRRPPRWLDKLPEVVDLSVAE